MRFNQRKGDIRYHDRLKPWSAHVKLNRNGCVVKSYDFCAFKRKAFNTAKNL